MRKDKTNAEKNAEQPAEDLVQATESLDQAVEGLEQTAEGLEQSAEEISSGMEEATYQAMNLNDQGDAALQAKVADLTEDLQRTRADFENFRKQTEVQKAVAEKSARLKTVFKVLPLLDDMGRAIASYEELAPLAKSLEKTLGELELQLIEADAGTEFNPDLHDAVAVEGEGEKEVIGEVLRPGYYYQGEVLRPAMVKVVKQ